jgi:hypothetical protein
LNWDFAKAWALITGLMLHMGFVAFYRAGVLKIDDYVSHIMLEFTYENS